MKKSWGHWTLKNCIVEALKYNKISNWIKKSPSSYQSALKNGWIQNCTLHITERKKYNGFWSKENCIIEAFKYATKTEWSKNSSSSYTIAHRNDWLIDCCKHMINIGSKHKRLIYGFEFSDKSVYVGLTYNSEERKSEHLNPKRLKLSSVHQHIIKTGLQPEFKKLTEYLDKDLAAIKEGEFLEQYKNNGWTILNKKKTGGLGGKTLIWTKEKCLEESMKFKTKGEWAKKSNSSYVIAHKNKWY